MKLLKCIVGLLTACIAFSGNAQDAQFVPFRGGSADGHHQAVLANFNQQNITMFSPFSGAAMADGFAMDSLINFNPRGIANLFSPFAGTAMGDGYASDSLIGFQQGNIAIFTPFGGGNNDGHYEGVLCNFPKIEGDTTIFLACSNDIVNLNDLVFETNFSARWNTPNPSSVGAGNYELRINNSGKCLDTAHVIVNLEIAIWTGSTNSNWHLSSNWNKNKVPDSNTHVIIPASSPECIISDMDAEARSVQVRTGGNLRTNNQKNLIVLGTCAQLPNN